MDPNLNNIGTEKIKEIYDVLSDAMIDGIEMGKISDDESKKSVEYILQNLDNVKTKQELITFLEYLCSTWPIYRAVYQQLINEQKTVENENKIEQVKNSLNNLTNN